MNKNIKRTMAMALTVSALASAAPVGSINILGLQEANAASNDKIYFDSLRVSGAGQIKLSDSKTKYSIYVPKSQESATITIKKDSSSDVIECSSGTMTGNESGTSTCKIKVDLDEKGSTANEFDVKVSNGDKQRTYTLKIYRKNVSSEDDEENDDIYLDKLTLSAGEIDFSRKKASFDVYVDKDVDSIKIQAKPEDEDYKVEIGGEEVDEDNKWRTQIDLKEGKNEIDVTIEDEDNDKTRTYKLNVYRGTKPNNTSTNSGEIDTKQDQIYIKKVVLDDGQVNIDFDKRITSYDIKVKSDLESIIVKAEPEDENDIVKIDGSKSDSKYRKRVALNSTGKTTIEIKVYNDEDDDDDDYKERIYNLNIIKEDSSNTNQNTTNNNSNTVNTNTVTNTNQNTTSNTTKVNQWVKNEYGLWQYFDALGKPITNQWFRDNGNWYYLGDYGLMKTGWLTLNGSWYYLNDSGIMQTGWVQERGAWYYLNSDGTMKTGWHQNWDGKWYYLNEHGVMLTNVYVNGYRLGSDGAWVR